MLKKILSFFYPITIYNRPSNISKSLEVTLYNGKTMLNTTNTNYSFGSLQKVLKKGLLEIGQSKIFEMNHILILGVAGGSIVQTLIKDFSFTKNIIGVELDAEVIEIANSFFNLDKVSNFKCIINDAEKFVKTSKDNYDLILIDVFKDAEMPAFLFENSFIDNVKQLLNINGYILFNTMLIDKNKKNKIELYLQEFENESYTKKVMNNVERYNDLILIQKLK